jgi:glutathione S-transferase
MYKLKLTYFDFNGGRGEPARLAMHIGNIAFEDFRFPFSEFTELKKTTPFNQVPVLEVDGHQITQCNSITRFVGKLAGLYPEDDVQALHCDEVMDVVEDATCKLATTFSLQGEAQQQARESLVTGSIANYLQWAEACLETQGGEYFADNRLTIADLKAFLLIDWLNSGKLDHIPTDLVSRVAPKLNEYSKRIANTPAILAYYAK